MSAGESLKSKLYRYFFPGWLLEQPPADIYGRHAARTRNRERWERWLPHYIRAHAGLTAFFGALLWTQVMLEQDGLCFALCACAMGVEICLTIFMVAAYAALRLQALAGDIDND